MEILKHGIAVFDSGIGGLTFLNECVKRVSNIPFYYYGDNFHAPYGNLSPQKIEHYVLSSFEKIARLSPRAAVLACNTATATCVEKLREKYSFSIIGLEPALAVGAKFCAEEQEENRLDFEKKEVFVLATYATCQSERLKKLKERVSLEYPNVKISFKPCELLAGEIEKNILNLTYDFTPFLPTGTPSAIVLGCTHYIYLKEYIQAHYACPVFDGNDGAVRRLFQILSQKTQNLKNDRDWQPLATLPQNHPKNLPIYFLGEAKKQNQTVFEQMFVNVRK